MRERPETGFDEDQGLSTTQIQRTYTKTSLWKSLKNPTVAGVSLFVAGGIPLTMMSGSMAGLSGFSAAPWFMGVAGPILLPLGWLVYLRAKPAGHNMPMRTPIQAGGLDPYFKDAKGKSQPVNGAHYLGRERKTLKQIWQSLDELKQHTFGLGTTGSGKTEMAIGILANALTMGSGFMFMDAKADIEFFYKIMALARRFGREDDVLFLNFSNVMPSAGEYWRGNNMNFLYGLPKDEMANLMVSLMSNMGGENKVFQDRAEQLLQALTAAMVWLRDNKGWSLSVGQLATYLQLEDLMQLAGGLDVNGKPTGLPRELQNEIASYIGGLAGLKKSMMKDFQGQLGARTETGKEPTEDKISPEMSKQHGFVIMQLTRMLSRLKSDYKHIFNIRYGDIDLDDIILNRRILLVQLPVLAKAPTETAALAKILVTNLSITMSRALGQRTTGDVKSVVEARVTKSPTPFYCIFDEAGKYLVKGMSTLYQQGRALNIAFFMFAQDLTALRAIEDKEADQVVGSANNVHIMKIQDAKTTGAFAVETGDKINAGLLRNFEQTGNLGSTVAATDDRQNQIDLRNKLTFSDLSAQRLGEGTLIAEGRVIRYKSFYANPTASIDPAKFKSLAPRRKLSWDFPTLDDIGLGVQPVRARPRPTADLAALSGVLDGGMQQNSSAFFNQPPSFLETVARVKATLPAAPPVADDELYPDGQIVAPLTATVRPLMPGLHPMGPPPARPGAVDDIVAAILEKVEERVAEYEQYRANARAANAEPGQTTALAELFNAADFLMPLAVMPAGIIDTTSAMTSSIVIAAVRGMGRRGQLLPPYVPPDWLTNGRNVDTGLGRFPIPGEVPLGGFKPPPAPVVSLLEDDDEDEDLTRIDDDDDLIPSYARISDDDEIPAWRAPASGLSRANNALTPALAETVAAAEVSQPANAVAVTPTVEPARAPEPPPADHKLADADIADDDPETDPAQTDLLFSELDEPPLHRAPWAFDPDGYQDSEPPAEQPGAPTDTDDEDTDELDSNQLWPITTHTEDGAAGA